jgi:hypothetical protein
MGSAVANMDPIHGMHALEKGFYDRPSTVKIVGNFLRDHDYENKIHGSGKNGNRFLLHY